MTIVWCIIRDTEREAKSGRVQRCVGSCDPSAHKTFWLSKSVRIILNQSNWYQNGNPDRSQTTPFQEYDDFKHESNISQPWHEKHNHYKALATYKFRGQYISCFFCSSNLRQYWEEKELICLLKFKLVAKADARLALHCVHSQFPFC